MGVAIKDINSANILKSDTSGNDTSRLEEREIAGSGAGSSRGSSSPNNFTSKSSTMGVAGLSTIIYPSASARTGTIFGYNRK